MAWKKKKKKKTMMFFNQHLIILLSGNRLNTPFSFSRPSDKSVTFERMYTINFAVPILKRFLLSVICVPGQPKMPTGTQPTISGIFYDLTNELSRVSE